MVENKPRKSGEQTGTDPIQVNAKEMEAKREQGEAEVEPIKPGDKRVARSSSLLGTCYTSTNRPPKPPED
ncbi:MAG TPA: hypothetical protein VN455_11505 [Methanotrichaceae archaeon]|nr:hypothetical protein [Methanotrichaceae archaeon]